MTTDASDEWRQRHGLRTEQASKPCGPLALTGTYRLEDHPDGRIPELPGRWTDDGDAAVLTAAEADAPTVDGRPFTGGIGLDAESGRVDAARVATGGRRLAVLVREGFGGVRDYDTATPARCCQPL